MNNRFIHKIVSLVTLFLLSEGTAFANDLRVVASEYPPYLVVNQGKAVDGFAYDWFVRVSEQIGGSTSLEVLPWARAIKIAKENPNVLILTVGKTESRESLFDWAEPYQKDRLAFFALKSREDILIESLDDVSNYRIAIYRQGASQELLLNAGIIKDRIIMVDKREQLIDLLKLDRVDLVVDFFMSFQSMISNDDSLNQRIESIGSQWAEIEIGLALSKNSDSKWLAEINKAQRTLRKNGEYDLLRDQWFGN